MKNDLGNEATNQGSESSGRGGGFPRNANQALRGAQKRPVSPALTQFPALNYHGAASR